MISASDISKTFNAGKPNEFTAVRDVSVTIDFHKVTILRGPSGSGKTTLLGLVGCMSRPTTGRIFLGEREITSLPERFLTDIRRRTFGFIFQQFNLIRGLTVLDNVMIPAYPSSEPLSQIKKRALETLALFNLEHKATAKIEWLSGGEAQRVPMAPVGENSEHKLPASRQEMSIPVASPIVRRVLNNAPSAAITKGG